MDVLLNEGRILYVDNLYTSITLARALLDKQTYLCGTVRKNRKNMPTEITEMKLKKMKQKENKIKKV